MAKILLVSLCLFLTMGSDTFGCDFSFFKTDSRKAELSVFTSNTFLASDGAEAKEKTINAQTTLLRQWTTTANRKLRGKRLEKRLDGIYALLARSATAEIGKQILGRLNEIPHSIEEKRREHLFHYLNNLCGTRGKNWENVGAPDLNVLDGLPLTKEDKDKARRSLIGQYLFPSALDYWERPTPDYLDSPSDKIDQIPRQQGPPPFTYSLRNLETVIKRYGPEIREQEFQDLLSHLSRQIKWQYEDEIEVTTPEEIRQKLSPMINLPEMGPKTEGFGQILNALQ